MHKILRPCKEYNTSATSFTFAVGCNKNKLKGLYYCVTVPIKVFTSAVQI